MRKTWVLITGATSGIGLTTAILLALEGYEVIATGRTPQKLEMVKQAAKKADVTLRTVLVDVTDESTILKCKDEILAMTDGYGVDILINNAGYAEGGAIEDIPLSRLRQQFETNVFGLVAMTQAFLPMMRKRKYGKIINISSVVGKVSIPLLGAYTATKHAVEAISDAMRVELMHTGIQVIMVAPGSIQTNFGNTVAGTLQDWADATSPYQSSYQKFMQDRNRESGAAPIVIAKTIFKAIGTKNPKARYAIPYDAKMMPILKAILPKRLLDGILRKYVMGK